MNKRKSSFPFGTEVEPIEAFDFETILKEKNEAKERASQEAKKRIDELKCPLCKSTNKKHVVKSENNGIFGPGHSSWIVDDYFVCQDCGVMYKEIQK